MKTTRDYAATGLGIGFVLGWVISVIYFNSTSNGDTYGGLMYIVAAMSAAPVAIVGLLISLVVKYFKK